MGRVDFFLLLIFAILFLVVHNSDGSGSCEYKHVNYTECEFMLWTKWTPCDGKVCPQGKQKRECVVQVLGTGQTLRSRNRANRTVT